MKKLICIILTCLMIVIMFCGCGDNNKHKTIETTTIAPFDLGLLNSIAKSATSADDLEKKLNDPNIFYHNTDVDNDGHIDYLNVYEEKTQHATIFKIIVTNNNNKVQITSLSIDNDGNANIRGNTRDYGNDNTYRENWSIAATVVGTAVATAALLSYANSPHVVYIPRHYNYNPPTYVVRRTVIPQSTFRTETIRRVSTIQKTEPKQIEKQSPPIKRNVTDYGSKSQFSENQYNTQKKLPIEPNPDAIKDQKIEVKKLTGFKPIETTKKQ